MAATRARCGGRKDDDLTSGTVVPECEVWSDECLEFRAPIQDSRVAGSRPLLAERNRRIWPQRKPCCWNWLASSANRLELPLVGLRRFLEMGTPRLVMRELPIWKRNTVCCWSRFRRLSSWRISIAASARLMSALRLRLRLVTRGKNGWRIRFAGISTFIRMTSSGGAWKRRGCFFRERRCALRIG